MTIQVPVSRTEAHRYFRRGATLVIGGTQVSAYTHDWRSATALGRRFALLGITRAAPARPVERFSILGRPIVPVRVPQGRKLAVESVVVGGPVVDDVTGEIREAA